MLDELTIYNLSVKYPNTIDLVREVERMTIDEFATELMKRFDETNMNDYGFYPNNLVRMVAMEMNGEEE